MILLLVFSILLSIVAATFALQNTAPISVKFLAYNFDGSLAIVLMVVFGLGILVAVGAMLPSLLTAKWQVLSHRRRVRQLEGKTRPEDDDPAAETFTPPAALPPPHDPKPPL